MTRHSHYSATEPEKRVAIAIKDLHFKLGRLPIMAGLKWELLEGSLAAVLGLTGSGKSTLLKLVAGIIKPDAGQIALYGNSPAATATRKLLGYMPQVAGLYPDLTVEENLRVFSIGHGVRGPAEAVLERTLEFVSMRQRRKELVRNLSIGFQQRVSLGVALLDDPAILILDEPFSHADAEFARRAWAHLHGLTANGRTVLIATSHPYVATHAKQVGVLRAGRLSSVGDTAAMAPNGRAKVTMKYRERTGVRIEELDLADYRTELCTLVAEATVKVTELEVKEITIERRLEQLMSEETTS